MRHNKKFNHLGRTNTHREAMLSNMASSLIKHKRIFTTTAKAKALRKFVEPLITNVGKGAEDPGDAVLVVRAGKLRPGQGQKRGEQLPRLAVDDLQRLPPQILKVQLEHERAKYAVGKV